MPYDDAGAVSPNEPILSTWGNKVRDNQQYFNALKRIAEIPVFGPTSAHTTGDGKAYLSISSSDMDGMVLKAVHARLITAGMTGTLDIQIHNLTAAVDMLSTKLTVDSGETGSETAATPAVINTANDDISQYDVLRIDIDAIHTTPGQGLLVTLEFGF